MAEETPVVEEVAVEPTSAILEGEEVKAALGEETSTEEDVQLPSDTEEFTIPEKFKGKSPEEIAKAYTELEKKLGEKAKEPEEPKVEDKKEDDKEPVPIAQDEMKSYVEEVLQNGDLSPDTLNALKEKGYSEEEIKAKVTEVKEYAEFQKYKQEKVLQEVLEPLGGGIEKFQEVATWAKETMSEADVIAFNAALSQATPTVQRAMLKGLYTEYETATDSTTDTIHSNNTPTSTTKGYTTQEEFFKDVSSPEYQNNPKFREAVERKMAKSDIF